MEEHKYILKQWLGAGSINLFGMPFAGKDTQGNYLADLFDGVMISGGDILRHTTDAEVQQIMAEGGIIPSEAWERIVPPFFANPDLAGRPLILSEVGRLKGEEQIIMRVTEATGHPQKAVIMLTLTEEEVWRRFDQSQLDKDRGERADDNKAVLQTRLDKYREKVLPVIDVYRQNGLLIEVDGALSREQVTQEIVHALLAKAQSN
jgi:adenylate kinase